MLTMKMIKYTKNGTINVKYKFSGTKEELLKMKRLYELAEDSFVDESEKCR